MLIPASADLQVYRGGTFETIIELFEDVAHTKVWKLESWVCELVIQGGPALAAGSGLTVTQAAGKIEVTLTPAQTQALGEERPIKYWLKLTKTTGNKEVWFPLAGKILAGMP